MQTGRFSRGAPLPGLVGRTCPSLIIIVLTAGSILLHVGPDAGKELCAVLDGLWDGKLKLWTFLFWACAFWLALLLLVGSLCITFCSQ